MSRRWIWLSGAAVAIAAVIGLVVSAAQPLSVRTYALDAPNQYQVALLKPATRVCEGPVASFAPFRSVAIWGGAVGPAATLAVQVQDASGRRTLATGQLTAIPQENEWRSPLDRELPAGRPVRICLNDVSGTFSLSGSPAVHPNLAMTGKVTGQETGQPSNQEFSLVLLSNTHRSLLTSLPLAFSRASLWRPSWVGSWTFWMLAAALLAAFGIAVLAVVRAATDEDGEERDDKGNGDRDAPLPSDHDAGDQARSPVLP